MPEKGALDYLKTYRSKNTVKNYRNGLRKFLESVYGESHSEDLSELADKYLSEGRDHEEDVKKFFASLVNCPPMSTRTLLVAVKVFLLENGIELKQVFWKQLSRRVKGTRALTIDRVPSNAELRKILTEMPAQGRALFLVMASSGMRIGEALQLKLEDVDLNSDPPKLSIRGAYTKSGNSRIAFISTEAKEALVDWLKQRGDYLRTSSGRSRYEKSLEDSRIFPFEDMTAYTIWANALRHVHMDEKDNGTGRAQTHPHVLRKFFRTRLGAVIAVDVTEALMGHEGYLTEVYRRYSEEDLAGFYKKGEHSLMVFGNDQDVANLRGEIEEKSKMLNEGMAALALKNADLENRLTAMIAENQSIKEKMAGVEERQRRYESFTTKFLEMSPEDLELLAKLIHDKKQKESMPDSVANNR